MTHFEFLMTIASVVLAIGLSELFAGWGRLIRSGASIRWSGLWIAWSIHVVVTYFMYWSGLWPYRDVEFDTGLKILWLAIPTFFMIVLSYLLSPDPEGQSEIDLDARYWRVTSRLSPLLLCVLIMSMLADRVILGADSGIQESQERVLLPVLGLSVIGLALMPFIRRAWFHWLVWIVGISMPVYWLLYLPLPGSK